MAGAGTCLFGGAFNPPHRTHRRIVTAALAQLDPERLLVLPCKDHPHKDGAAMPPAEHRLRMCELAFAGLDPRVQVSDLELRREGPSYTVDTVRQLRTEVGLESPLWLLVGSDNLPLLATWHDYHSLLELATVVTFLRRGHPVGARSLRGVEIRRKHKSELLENVLDFAPDAVSATRIREQLARGDDVAEIAPAVLDYIREHGLYGTRPADDAG